MFFRYEFEWNGQNFKIKVMLLSESMLINRFKWLFYPLFVYITPYSLSTQVASKFELIYHQNENK